MSAARFAVMSVESSVESSVARPVESSGESSVARPVESSVATGKSINDPHLNIPLISE